MATAARHDVAGLPWRRMAPTTTKPMMACGSSSSTHALSVPYCRPTSPCSSSVSRHAVAEPCVLSRPPTLENEDDAYQGRGDRHAGRHTMNGKPLGDLELEIPRQNDRGRQDHHPATTNAFHGASWSAQLVRQLNYINVDGTYHAPIISPAWIR